MGKKQKRKQRDDSKLRDVSEHLLYEIQMLFGTVEALATSDCPTDPKNKIIHNALLDSFAIHSRALLYFLYPTNPQPDDVIAKDFFDNSSEWVEEQSECLKPIRKPINKRVAHLTYYRLNVKPKEKAWQYTNIADEIGKTLSKFLHKVPPSRVGKSFRDFISQTVDAEDVKQFLRVFSQTDGGASFMLDPATGTLLTVILNLSPAERRQLLSEAQKLAEQKDS